MDKKAAVRDFGQLFILAFDGLHLTREVVEFFKTFRIGGVILFRDNFENPLQLKRLTEEIQSKCSADGVPLFICTDHEGGKRQEFLEGFTRVPPMASLVDADPSATEALHRTIARELVRAGVNMNLAPVADLIDARAEGNIGDRSFGVDPEKVLKHVVAAIGGMQGEGLMACVKHFPGHGITTKNSHEELPVSDVDFDRLMCRDLIPFHAAIAAGVSAVMTAHLLFPRAGDAHNPVTLSNYWLTGVLRQQLGFKGPIITDALEMKALLNTWSPFECGVKSLEAGASILLYYKEKTQFETFYALRRALEKGDIDHAQVQRRLLEVREHKKKWILEKQPA